MPTRETKENMARFNGRSGPILASVIAISLSLSFFCLCPIHSCSLPNRHLNGIFALFDLFIIAHPTNYMFPCSSLSLSLSLSLSPVSFILTIYVCMCVLLLIFLICFLVTIHRATTPRLFLWSPSSSSSSSSSTSYSSFFLFIPVVSEK